MKKYNRAMDFIVVASTQFMKGNLEQAAKLFAKAMAEPDAVSAVKILEANNKHAFAAEQERVTAARIQAKKATGNKVVAKKADKVQAKRVTAADDEMTGDEFDDGDVSALIDDEFADDAEVEAEADDEFAEDEFDEMADEDVESDDEFATEIQSSRAQAFAKVLAGMKKPAKKARSAR